MIVLSPKNLLKLTAAAVHFTDLLFGGTKWLNSHCSVVRYCAQSGSFLPLLRRSSLSIFHFCFLQRVAFVVVLKVVGYTKILAER